MTLRPGNAILAPVMDMHHLRIFLSVFRNRSFTKASQQLHLSQPTVSDHIRTLEEYLEASLFDRLGKKIIPTREAEVLHNYAIEIIEKADGIRHAIGQFKKEVSGELVMGASSIPGTYLLPGVVASFKEKYPSVSFQVLVSDSRAVVDKLSNHEMLIGLVGTKLHNSFINYEPFMEDELIVVSSPSLARSSKITLNALLQHPIVCREEGSGTRREAERILSAHGLPWESMRQAAVFGSTDAIKQAVKAGLGIAIVSKFAVADELRHRTLKRVRIFGVEMRRSFYIATHRKRSLPRIYRMFLDHLKSGRPRLSL